MIDTNSVSACIGHALSLNQHVCQSLRVTSRMFQGTSEYIWRGKSLHKPALNSYKAAWI